jgi:hypothetical protein
MMNKYSNGLSLGCLLASVLLGSCSESNTPVVELDNALDDAAVPEQVVTETTVEEPATDTGQTEGGSSSAGTQDPPAARGPAVGFTTGQLEVEAGDVFSLDVRLENFPLSEGGGITVRFNQDVVRVIDVVIDSAWNFAASDGDIDNPSGVISDILVSSYQGVEGEAAVATIRMQAIAPGSSNIILSESQINPFAAQGAKVGPALVGALVTVR